MKFVKPTLTVKITGGGRVQMIARAMSTMCNTSPCTLEPPLNTAVRLQALAGAYTGPPALAPKFRKWRAPSGQVACTGGPTSGTCLFTFTHSVELRAFFANDQYCNVSPDC